MKENFFSKLVETLDTQKKCRVAIPLAQDDACAYAVCQGVKMGIIEALLIGDKKQISEMYSEILDNDSVTIIEESTEAGACKKAVSLVRNNESDILMKGLVSTSTLLKAVLSSTEGLKKNPLMSHLAFFELPGKPGLRILTDAAMTISPDADALEKEIYNACEAFSLFEQRPIKVSLLAANEKVSEKVPSTTLAKEVSERFKGNSNLIVEGPISFDLSVSAESAEVKKYAGKIKGDADIFVVPRIEVGNALYKSLQYFIKAPMGGLVYGAKCPVVLTSRADDNNTKFNSLLLGVVLWQRAQESNLNEKTNQQNS